MELQEHDKLSKLSDADFKRYTGASRFVFNLMVLLINIHNSKKIKSGRTPNLSVEDQVLLTLEYYRENRTFFHLGTSYGLAESNAFRTIKKSN